jgi:uncharacterized protein YndB with AHSA1/START domain
MALTILLIIAFAVMILLLIAALMRKEYSIHSEIIINQPKNKVFEYIKDLRNQEKYSIWVMADPEIRITYSGQVGKVGFKSAWVSDMKNVGVGEQEITNIVEGERYDVEIRFEKPFKGISQATTTTQSIDINKTIVTTTFNTKTPFPMNLMSPMIKKMLKKDMNGNALRLKNILETIG